MLRRCGGDTLSPGMDFERKSKELEQELAAQERERAIPVVEVEVELAPEPETAAAFELAPVRAEDRPDPLALRAWVDDLVAVEEAHRGDAETHALAEKLRNQLADDLSAADHERLARASGADDGQLGFVGDFQADRAIEGGAQEVRDPEAVPASPPVTEAPPSWAADDDAYLVHTAHREWTEVEPLDYGGGGGGGGGTGGGGATPPAPPTTPPPSDEPPTAPSKPSQRASRRKREDRK